MTEHDEQAMSINRRRTARRILVVGALVAAIIVGLWWGNTRTINFNVASPPTPAAPGATVDVAYDGFCAQATTVVYQPSRLGRWQQTHVGGIPDVRRWYEVRSREHFPGMGCPIGGPWRIEIPEDVDSDRIAVCGLASNDCVEILVDRAD